MQRILIITGVASVAIFGGIASYFLNIDSAARGRVDCLRDANDVLHAEKDKLCAADGLESGCQEYWHEPNEVTEPLLRDWAEANKRCDQGS